MVWALAFYIKTLGMHRQARNSFMEILQTFPPPFQGYNMPTNSFLCSCSSAQLHRFWHYGIVASTMAEWLAFCPVTPEAQIRIPAGATQLKWRNQLLYSGDPDVI